MNNPTRLNLARYGLGLGLVFALIGVPAGAVDINFDYFPAPDGVCGTGDDVAVTAGEEFTDQYMSCGVMIENTVSSTGDPGLYAVPEGGPGSTTTDIIPTTPQFSASPLDIPMDVSISSTGNITFTFFPSAADFSLDFLDVEGSGTPGTGNTYIDVFLTDDPAVAATRLLVPSGPNASHVDMSYAAPAGLEIVKILVSLNDGVVVVESSAVDSLVFNPPEDGGGCWLTSGGWTNAFVSKGRHNRHSFGGNVGPPPSGS